MACTETHPEHGVPCEGERPGHLGRHFSTWPYREWGELVSAPVCGAAHASGYLCGKDAHAEEERHSAAIGWGWLVWGAGLPDVTHAKRSTQEWNALSEREDNAKYDAARGREAWRPDNDGLRTWRWL